MKIRAVICDIYTTILEVGAPPPNADDLWLRLFEEFLGTQPPIGRMEFSVRTNRVVARLHAAAKARGIAWPEILWPAVVLEAVPDLVRLSASQLDEFLFRQMQIGRTLRLADGAADCLRHLKDNDVVLGIASNSQAYTLRELTEALEGTGLNLASFDRDVCFWSFKNGFSKPDPHVFRILTARLEARGIRPAETLMVGDRFDNDIEPARAFGWQTWQMTSRTTNEPAGDWHSLRAWLESQG